MLIIAGHLLFESAHDRDRVVAESAPVQALTRAWPGCLAYCFTADPVDPLVMQVYEAWTDGAALRAHFTHPDYRQMRAVLNSGGRSTQQKEGFPQVHHVTASMSVYDDARQPHPSYFEDASVERGGEA